MSLELALPPGEPETLRTFSSTLRSLGADLSRTATALQTERARLDGVWTGVSAGQAAATLTGLSISADMGAEAMGAGSIAVIRYARVLEAARDEVLVLRRRKAEADVDLAHGLAAARRDEVEPFAYQRAVASLHAAHADRLRALAAGRSQVEADCERAGLVLRRALEDTRGPFVRGHRESIEDYCAGMISALLGRLPVLADHPAAVRALAWASMTSLPSTVKAATTGRLLSEWLQATARWTGGPRPVYTPTNLPLWAKALQSRAPAIGTFLQGNNPFSGTAAMRGQSLTAIYGQSRNVLVFGGQVGVFRGLGLAGSATATVMSGLNVAAQGNPVRAYQENGAAYVADVSETLFHGSVTALLIAPNPVTAGAVVITGTAYLAAEVWANREHIAALATDGVRLAQDVGRRGLEAAGDVLGTVDRAVDGVVDGAVDRARQVGSALNPFD